MCLPILGAVVSGVGAAMGAMAQASQARAQAELQRRQAEIERESGSYEGARTMEKVERVLGSARAGVAASGLGLSGSAGASVDESATEGALDVAAIRWNSKPRVDNKLYEAKISDMNARMASAAAPIAFLSPVISGIAQYRSSFA